MSTYPVITWQVDIGGDISVTANGVTTVITVPSQSVWGYGNTGLGFASVTTIAGAISQEIIDDHAEVTGSVPTSSYQLGDTGPRIRWQFQANGATTFNATGTTFAAAALGLDALPKSFTNTTGSTYRLDGTRFWPGVWWPGCEDIRPEFNEVHRALLDESPFDGTVTSAEYLGKVTERAQTFDVVDAAYILTQWRSVGAIATRSGQSASDPYGALSQMLEACLHGKPLRVYTSDGEYFDARLSNRRTPRTVLDLAVARADDRSRFNVTIPLVEL